MAKTKPNYEYVCKECGEAFSKWTGKCNACGAWSSLEERTIENKSNKRGLGAPNLEGTSQPLKDIQCQENQRLSTGNSEFDRTLGGGLAPGSLILIGGDPGIGKSTLLLQAMNAVSRQVSALYISGEESISQIRMRAKRLGLDGSPMLLACETNVKNIVASIEKEKPDVVVIDSIQTMFSDLIDSAPGTVSQVKTSGNELIRVAKTLGTILLIVGHVTKEGMIAGPRVLEHMVDTVLYFEGERAHHFRILRSTKNRFGATDEIGVFEMEESGLCEVLNPSALFLAERRGNISGNAVFAGIEGTRPILLEVQALVTPTSLPTPRRTAIGWDYNRLSMLIAVLEARAGINFAGYDIYMNFAGGFKITEPSVDLAAAAALISAKTGIPTPADMVFFGEIGLSGEIRSATQTENRLKESAKLGFKTALMPKGLHNKKALPELGIRVTEIGHIQDLIPLFGKK